jgi:L-ascorbate metabolism protein UlaG (beta-lactamase superfamily)
MVDSLQTLQYDDRGKDGVALLSYLVTHYYHSGFSVACEDTLLIFDYWLGEGEELAEQYRVTPETLSLYKQIYVFISHDHPDHMDPVVFTWKDVPGIQYIVSSDMPVGTRGRRMAPGDVIRFSDDVEVSAFDSTDLGVSFLVDFRGLQVFHAGDLNFWHWRDESTMKEIEEADAEFRKAIAPICGRPVDLAFFPLDPRQGSMFEAGANFFILSVKPRILIPMHYFHRAEVAMEYARTASCRSTEVIALPGYGDLLAVELDDEGYLNLSFPERGGPPEEEEEEEPRDLETILTGDDPFNESDLPLLQLAEDMPGEEAPPEVAGDPAGENPPKA